MKITRKTVNEAISRVRHGIMPANPEMSKLMDEVLKHRCEMQTLKEWRDAAYYSFKQLRG